MDKSWFTKIVGTRFQREMKRIRPIVDAIHRHEEHLKTLSDAELQAQTPKLRGLVAERTGTLAAEVARLKREKHECPEAEQRAVLGEQLSRAESAYVKELQAVLNDVLPEAFATVREACRRLVGSEVVVTGHALKWDMVPYDVQLIGGVVLHQGKIAEMATGEGKTLVATLPLYLNALAGRGAHLVTVNNYLARRDSQWMGHLFTWLGLTVGCIDDTEPSTPARRAVYQCDITYGTNNEFGFDYLRDNMVFALEQRVQRTHAYAIIDEVDSILIDEARTPLIISGPVGSESDEKYALFNTQVVQLVRKQTAVANDLIARAEPLVGNDKTAYEGATLLYQAQLGMPKNKKLLKLLQEPGVKSLVQRVELDVLADRKLPAREQKLRHIEDELYFVLDERGHSVHLTEEGVETMSPQDPNLFVVPDISHAVHDIEHDEHLSPKEKIERRRQVEAEYALKSETLHIIHKLLQAHALYEREVDYVVQEGKVLIVDEFTGRLMHGRRWSEGLHQAVEAKEGVAVQEESQTLATITIQNYFRMYDKLAGMTGTAETEETEFFQIYGLEVVVIPTNRPVRRIDKHDLIYKTRREKYNAIMDEVERQHKRGLPVLVGTVSVDVSETLSRMLKRRGLRHEVLNAKYHEREAEIVAQAGQPASITIATNMAGRGTDIKLGPGVKKCQVCGITAHQAPFGQQIEKPDLSPEEIKRLQCQEDPPCGLVIVGTERHEARRIDRQLRGRSGRQGDPGQSVFFLSLEDDLMRLFGSDRIARWMDRTGAEEGEVITHPWVTSAIGQAQKRVELQNFQARKKLLEYDDVMNQQREVIYSLRLFALEGGEELRAEAVRMIEQAVERLADELIGDAKDAYQWDRALMETEFLLKLLISIPGLADPAKIRSRDELVRAAQQAGRAAFEAKLDYFKEIESKVGAQNLGGQALSHIMLTVIDEKWKDHLYDLDQLKAAIQYRAWGQKDPLVEYKQEGYDMFVGLMRDVHATFAERWLKLQIEVGPPPGDIGGPGVRGPRPGPVGGARPPPPQVGATTHAHGGLEARGRRADPERHARAADAGPGGPGPEPLRQRRAQRPVPVRERQEVQEVPRGGLKAERGTRNRQADLVSVVPRSNFRVPRYSGTEIAPAATYVSLMPLRLCEHPQRDRPRERLWSVGPAALTGQELLAILLGTGCSGRDALAVAGDVLARVDGSLRRLAGRPSAELARVPGVGRIKAARVAAALELGRRVGTESEPLPERVRGPADVQRFYGTRLRDLAVEEFHVLALGSQSQILGDLLITRGILNSSLVHPREVFRAAIAEAAAGIIVVHNHPSGDPTPSADDRAVTRQLVDAGRLLDLPVYDHVIVGGDRYVSFAEAGLL